MNMLNKNGDLITEILLNFASLKDHTDALKKKLSISQTKKA